MAKRTRADDELAAALTPDDVQSCSDAQTAELLAVSVKTLQRLDAKKAARSFLGWAVENGARSAPSDNSKGVMPHKRNGPR